MNTIIAQAAPFIALLVALIAAVIDARTGRIPNVLTLPVLLVAPIAYGISGGVMSLAASLGGALLCLAVPWIFYRVSNGTAIGGGDVKLFAALGALVGPSLGLEIEFSSFVLLGVIAVTKLTFTGKLWRLLVSTGWILFNPFLPKHLRRVIPPEALTEMRMGPAIFLGALLVILLERFGVAQWLA